MRPIDATETTGIVSEKNSITADIQENNDSSDIILEIQNGYQIQFEPEIGSEISEQPCKKKKTELIKRCKDKQTQASDFIINNEGWTYLPIISQPTFIDEGPMKNNLCYIKLKTKHFVLFVSQISQHLVKTY